MPSESAKKRQAQKKERERQRQKQASAKRKQKTVQVNGANGDVTGDSEGACAAASGPVPAVEDPQVKSKPVDKKMAARSCTGKSQGAVFCPVLRFFPFFSRGVGVSPAVPRHTHQQSLCHISRS